MSTSRELLRRWLALEQRAGEEDTAPGEIAEELTEELLRKLFVRLPSYVPSVAFVDSVITALRPSRARWFAYWGVRAAVALCAVQAGLLLGGATTVLRPLLQSLSPLGVVTSVVGLLARSLEWLAELPRLGLGAAELGSALYRAASSPTLLVTVILCVGSSAVGLLMLSNLVPSQREPACDAV